MRSSRDRGHDGDVIDDVIDDDALDELERELFGRARGRVLEIGAGEGENFGAFDPSIAYTGLEPDARRRDELATRGREWGHPAPPVSARAERMPLLDASFDTVVASYVLCSVGDVAAALAEVRRVLVPGGRLVLVEHVLAPARTLTRAVQRVATPVTAVLCGGCHWNRDPSAPLAVAGFEALQMRRMRVRASPFGWVPVLLYEGRRTG